MTEVKETPKTSEVQVVIKEQKIKQALTVTDLETGDDTAKVDNSYSKFTAPAYDKKYGTMAQFEEALFKLAESLVQPISNRIDALLYRATQDSYQAGKVAAFASGNYLSPELRGKVTEIITSSSPKYANEKAVVVFGAWKAAFTSQSEFDGVSYTPEQITKRKVYADKMLGIAQTALAPAEVDGF